MINPVKITLRNKAVEKVIAMKVATDQPDLSSVVHNALATYQKLLDIAKINGKDFVWVEQGEKLVDVSLIWKREKNEICSNKSV